MLSKTGRKSIHFFSVSASAATEFEKAKLSLLQQLDYTLFQQQSLELIKTYGNEETFERWQLFCKHLKEFSDKKAEQMMLLQTAFHCLKNAIEQGELAQFVTLARHLKSLDGTYLLHLLLKSNVPDKERIMKSYLEVCQLLIDLHEEEPLAKIMKATLPNLSALLEQLRILHAQYLAKKYPEDDLDTLINRFIKKDEFIQFPLDSDELKEIKQDYLAIKEYLKTLKGLPQALLQEQLKQYGSLWKEQKSREAKQHILAILAETIRQHYGIFPYSTQIFSLLALINTPEKLKGRIGQIKTGEGKSTIIAMLAAFMGCQDLFVDVITSSEYLAIRDCKKYQPFFKALGVSASHISHDEPKQKHFHAQILFGTNTNFEFAFLRDGLYNRQLRYSRRFDGKLIERPFEVAIIDEVDNLFLDTALSSSQMGIRDYNDISWIYQPILRFVQSQPQDVPVSSELTKALRQHLSQYLTAMALKYQAQLASFSDAHLKRWFESAHTVWFVKKRDRDYIVKVRKNKQATQELDICIVDYKNTGRTNDGCQWQHGMHQFLQVKENLKVTSPIKTAASVSHPTFFNLYQQLLGLTGTMGEAIERQEIQAIYQVGSFDVPPYRESRRKRKPDCIVKNQEAKWDLLLQQVKDMQQQGLPALILFKTIKESNEFSVYLAKRGVKHQLLNETQREAEEYIVGQAGEPGIITNATNTAGRGTDIILAPKSKEAGGLQMIFTFYPDNLRVEGQGFGRAGRQGQPGSCNMVLDAEDESILSLMKVSHSLSQRLRHQLQNCLMLQDQANKLSSLQVEYIDDLYEELKGEDDVEYFVIEINKAFLLSQKKDNIKEPEVTFPSNEDSYHDKLEKLTERTTQLIQNTSQSIIQLLEQLRTSRIQQESANRAECARQERLYFEKLQDFFSKMKVIYCLVESDSFKHYIRQLCTADIAPQEDINTVDLNAPYWVVLKEMATLLLKQSLQGITVDWSTFVNDFKEAYVSHICDLWGSYYSKLKDPLEAAHREVAYAKVVPYLLEPQRMAGIALAQVLAVNHFIMKPAIESKTYALRM